MLINVETRLQTLENRTKKERMLEKRKTIMKVRLAKVKQRRLQREGKTMEDEDSELCSAISLSVNNFGARLVYFLYANHPLTLLTDPTN